MCPSIRKYSTQAFIEAAESNLVEKCLSFARQPCGEVHGPNPVWFVTGSHVAGYNGIARACLPAADVDAAIADALRPFHQRGLPLTWWTGPSSQPGSLGARLQAAGFRHNRDMIGMCAEMDQLISTGEDMPAVEIEPVTTREGLAEWLPIYAQGFGTPPTIARESLEILALLAFDLQAGWKHFCARQNGQIIAISSLFINDGIGGLYNLVTLPEARGQGIGAAVTLRTFAAARDMGCQIATLQTTYPNALRLYHRLGLEVYCKFGIYQFIRP